MKNLFIIIIILSSTIIFSSDKELDMSKNFAVPDWTYDGLEVMKAHLPIDKFFDTNLTKYTFSRIEFGRALYKFILAIFYDISKFNYNNYTYKDIELISKMIIEFKDEIMPESTNDSRKLVDTIKNINFIAKKLKNKLFVSKYHHFQEKPLNEVICLPEKKVASLYEDYRKKELKRQLVIAKDPKTAKEFVAKYLNEGIIAFRLKEYTLSMLKLKLAYTKMPNNPVIHFWIARVYCKKGYYKKAIKRWEKIISLVDSDIILREYRVHKDVMDVITEVEEVVKAYPDSSIARYFLGTLYLKNTKYHKRAVEEFNKVVSIEKNNLEYK